MNYNNYKSRIGNDPRVKQNGFTNLKHSHSQRVDSQWDEASRDHHSEYRRQNNNKAHFVSNLTGLSSEDNDRS